MCFLLYSSYVCISAYVNVYFKTTNINKKTQFQNNTHMSEVHCRSAVRFGQVLPGYLITAHHLYACLL